MAARELISNAEVGDWRQWMWRAVKKLLAAPAGADQTMPDDVGFSAWDHAAFLGHTYWTDYAVTTPILHHMCINQT
jgi:hypothetical protein